MTVVLGDHDVNHNYEPQQLVERNVKRVIVHRGYIARTFDNDLALLELEKPVKFQEHILPVCLPEGSDDYVGDIAYVTGWGRLSHGEGIDEIFKISNSRLNKDTWQQPSRFSNNLQKKIEVIYVL